MPSLGLAHQGAKISTGQTREGAGDLKSDRPDYCGDETGAVPGTTAPRGNGRATKDQNGMMDEKRCVDNELAQMKERTFLERDVKSAKSPEEWREAQRRTAEAERDAKLRRR